MPPRSYPLRRRTKYAFGDTKFKRPSAQGLRRRVTRTSSAVSSELKKQSAFTMQNTGASGLGGFPSKKSVTLRYADEITLTPGAVGIQHFFRINSLYDPDYTGTGHQPLGFDQWAAVYSNYYVRRARLKVTEMIDGTANVVPSATFLGVSDSLLNYPTSISEAAEHVDYSKPMQTGVVIAGTSRPPNVLIQEIDVVKFLKKGNLNDADMLSGVGQNPVNPVYAIIDALPINGNTPGSCHFLVEIEFDCVFQNPKQLAQS